SHGTPGRGRRRILLRELECPVAGRASRGNVAAVEVVGTEKRERVCRASRLAAREERLNRGFAEAQYIVAVCNTTAVCREAKERGPGGVVLCRDRESFECQLVGRRARAEGKGTAGPVGERLPRRFSERRCVEPGRLAERERLVVVVGEHLGVILGPVAGEG